MTSATSGGSSSSLYTSSPDHAAYNLNNGNLSQFHASTRSLQSNASTLLAAPEAPQQKAARPEPTLDEEVIFFWRIFRFRRKQPQSRPQSPLRTTANKSPAPGESSQTQSRSRVKSFWIENKKWGLFGLVTGRFAFDSRCNLFLLNW